MGLSSPFRTLGETMQKINLELVSENCRGLTVGRDSQSPHVNPSPSTDEVDAQRKEAIKAKVR